MHAYGPTPETSQISSATCALRGGPSADYRPDVILSTGAALAVPFFIVGRMHGMRLVYVESFTRVQRPALSGRMVYPLARCVLRPVAGRAPGGGERPTPGASCDLRDLWLKPNPVHSDDGGDEARLPAAELHVQHGPAAPPPCALPDAFPPVRQDRRPDRAGRRRRQPRRCRKHHVCPKSRALPVIFPAAQAVPRDSRRPSGGARRALDQRGRASWRGPRGATKCRRRGPTPCSRAHLGRGAPGRRGADSDRWY